MKNENTIMVLGVRRKINCIVILGVNMAMNGNEYLFELRRALQINVNHMDKNMTKINSKLWIKRCKQPFMTHESLIKLIIKHMEINAGKCRIENREREKNASRIIKWRVK